MLCLYGQPTTFNLRWLAPGYGKPFWLLVRAHWRRLGSHLNIILGPRRATVPATEANCNYVDAQPLLRPSWTPG